MLLRKLSKTILVKIISILIPFIVSQNLYAQFESIDSIAAIVEEGIILKSQLDERVNTIKHNLANASRPIPSDIEIQKEILEQLILETIQLQLAEKSGIRINDNTLSDTLEKIAKQNGKDLQGFKEMVEEDGLTYKDVRNRVRNDLIIGRLRQRIITNRITISSQDVANYLQSPEGIEKLSASYRLGHILLKNKSEDEAQALVASFRNNQNFETEASKRNSSFDLGWRKLEELPTPFVESSKILTIGEIAEPIKTPSGYHIIKLLDKKGGDHKIIAQTRARHILIKPNEIRDRTDSKQTIIDIRQQIVNNEKDFAEMARTYSEDPVSGNDGGNLGWSAAGDFVPVFEKNMNDLDINEISEPFFSTFGWHIIQVLERRQENIGKEHQLNQARAALQKKYYEEEIQLWLREIRENAFVEIKIFPEQEDEIKKTNNSLKNDYS